MGSFKQSIGLRLQKAYAALPFGWKFRLALKNVLFTLCAPFIRDTNAFKRWKAFNNMRAPEGLPVVRADQGRAVANGKENADTPVLHRYVEDLMRRTATAHGADYVEMRPGMAPPSACAAKAIAFYLPQFHPIAENDKWWGRGFTEWTNVSKALPQFVGHHQPHLPGELGFYDLRIVDIMRRQAELAKLHGIHGFCFHHYWFSGRRLLEGPLDQLIANPDIDLPFCVCWANENWTRRWDGHDQDVLLGQSYTPDDDLKFISDLAPYLRDPRYIRVDGRLLLIVYRPSLLPDCNRTIRIWRDYCRAHGLGEIFLAMVQFDVDDPRGMGFDAAIEFPPHKLARGLPCINDRLEIVNPDYSGYIVDYGDLAERGENWPVPDYALFKGVAPRWDNEARKPGKGYTFAGSTPERYGEWLRNAVDYSRKHPVSGESIVFINAWNEWAEGAHLEPDRRFGYAYLEATRGALDAAALPSKVLVVSHDAHPHGAQYLALNMCRGLRSLGFDVNVVLLGGGVLEPEFAEAAKVWKLECANGSDKARQLAERLVAEGIGHAIANTSVSGLFANDLKKAGMHVVSLVHELPGVIESYGLRENAAALAMASDRVVFAAEEVRTAFEGLQKLDAGKVLIRPQGLYKRNRNRSPRQIRQARDRLRDKLGLAHDALIVLGVGYADLRKGADLFISIGERMVKTDPRVHLVWLGHIDTQIEQRLKNQIEATRHPGHFHFVGRNSDTDDFYAGADLLALTSREDPFPSVVMESLDVAVPVVGFSGAGGFESLLARGGGALAPGFDTEAFADACLGLLGDPHSRDRMGKQGKELIDLEFSFRSYLFDLLGELGIRPPRVSVVVPNYNYARYLVERLESIASQTLPVYEIIVLDDASTDDSADVLADVAGSIEMRLIANETNSGSVFRQWLKGVGAASGDFVWIAEADDLADPQFLETVMRGFTDESFVMSYCQSQQIDGAGNVLANDYLDYVADISSERWRKPFAAGAQEELRNGLAVKNTIPNVSAVVFRREALLKALSNGVEEIASFRIAGDWLTYLMVLQEGRLAFNPEALNRHRRHQGSVTLGADNTPHLREVLRMQRIARDRFGAGSEESRAWDYANVLYRNFGMVTPHNPTVQSRPEFRDA